MRRHEGGFQLPLQTGPARRRDSLASVSSRLADDFHSRAKEAVRAIIRWQGGDHVGPLGYPCRKCRPFPFLLYYRIEGDVLYVLGIVHERRHPDYLHKHLGDS